MLPLPSGIAQMTGDPGGTRHRSDFSQSTSIDQCVATACPENAGSRTYCLPERTIECSRSQRPLILIQQSSSIRLSGGVEIDGAPPSACAFNGGAVGTSVVIQQESNGFFNLSQGGTSAFTGGGISCAFAGIPNAHVTGKANIARGRTAGRHRQLVASAQRDLPGLLGSVTRNMRL